MKRIGQILEEIISKNKRLEKLKVFQIKAVWKETVGEKVASRAKVVDYKNGSLFVECNDPLWMAEIELRKDVLKKRFNERVGKEMVKKIVVRGGWR